MSDTNMSQAEIAEIFGGEVQPIQVDPQELEVGLALEHARSQIVECMERYDVGTVQLADRLHVHPSSVSRFLGSGGDMKVSTAVQYGRALGQTCTITYTPNYSCTSGGSYHNGAVISAFGTAALTSGAAALLTINSGGWPITSKLGVNDG